MKFKLIFIMLCVTCIFFNCSMTTRKIAASKKAEGTVYYLDTVKKTLTVVMGEKEKGAEKIEKIFYNNKDYTKYVKDLLDSKPAAYVSDQILIFSEKGVTTKDRECRCGSGIVFIPGDSEVLFIEASDILYNSEKNIIQCSHAIVKIKRIEVENK